MSDHATGREVKRRPTGITNWPLDKGPGQHLLTFFLWVGRTARKLLIPNDMI